MFSDSAPHIETLHPHLLPGLLAEVAKSRPDSDLAAITKAYVFADTAHKDQKRLSGEPYIVHPVEVTKILAQIGMDDETLMAGLLHDVLEDCRHIGEDDIRREFGEPVLMLVDGVTKLKTNLKEGMTPDEERIARLSRTAESMRRLLLAMAKDLRVMFIKLADRLHNMRTIDATEKDKSPDAAEERRHRIASETLDVYAPIAARLGIWQIKWQLEDESFKVLHRREFAELSQMIGATRVKREEELARYVGKIVGELDAENVPYVKVTGRPKHLYSIFKKMKDQKVDFGDIHDLSAIRIITRDKASCYLAVGVVSSLFNTIPSLSFDYIAKPKKNGYMSYHVKAYADNNNIIEIQIRSEEMHRTAEFGFAAHWSYKEGKLDHREQEQFEALRQEIDVWSDPNKPALGFWASLKAGLFQNQIFIFTPKGEPIELPIGATPIDMAYRLHTQLGNTLIGARVNGLNVKISTVLQSGDVVELITKKGQQPSMDWVKIAVTSSARSKIKAYFRNKNRSERVSDGKASIDRELKSLGLDPRRYLGEEKLNAVAPQFHSCKNGEDLLARVGEGLVGAANVVRKLQILMGETGPVRKLPVIPTTKVMGKITNAAGVAINRGRCCAPVPGDDVVAYTTRGRGFVLHRVGCKNEMAFRQTDPGRLNEYVWDTSEDRYPVPIQVICVDRNGLTADVTGVFAEMDVGIRDLKISTSSNQQAVISGAVMVHDLDELNRLFMKISQISDVISIVRLSRLLGA